jgi:hypothetical protein
LQTISFCSNPLWGVNAPPEFPTNKLSSLNDFDNLKDLGKLLLNLLHISQSASIMPVLGATLRLLVVARSDALGVSWISFDISPFSSLCLLNASASGSPESYL